ncbi:MAG TPA: hypothetical protein VEK57_03715 [Thermoanaerobaculia bacterium]|nr:hypothetical protein [Thermoanaerobaculia bacterium]
MPHESADAALHAYLAGNDAEAEWQLARILDEVALPLVRRVVGSVCREPAAAGDAEDLVADTLTDLLRRLRDLRDDRTQPPIEDLRRYIVTSAYNRCHERLRRHFPARNRLRNQLQYLCGHDPRLAIWRTADGVMVCGLRAWLGREARADGRAEELCLAACSDPSAENRAQIVKLVPALFRELGGPLDLDTLVATMARLIGLEQQRVVEVPLELLAQPGAAADSMLELRVSLRELWADVRRLAPKQRAALLLNLRDVQGRECLSLLPLTRTATLAEIAAAVEMPPGELAKLWNGLPLSDAQIGTLLGATQRQVIKLRSLARERLRRMEKARVRQNAGGETDFPAPADLVSAARGRGPR